MRTRSLLSFFMPLAVMTATAMVAVVAPAAGADGLPCDTYTDVALGKTATASSVNSTQTPAKAVDGNNANKWGSLASDPQWLQVDLGSVQGICSVTLLWANYATAFSLQVSADATNWTTLISTGATKNGSQSLSVSGSGRYIRMYGTARADTTNGYGIREFDVYSPANPQPPVFTSPATAAFSLGVHDNFSVTTRGVPAVTGITESGALPAGLRFTDGGDGTASVVGTPTGSGGSYPVTLTASNGVTPNATQTLTIQVITQPPAFTSPASVTFPLGSSSNFAISTSGIPKVTTITESGSLPPGVTFTNHGDGTAGISGTPTGSAGSYPVTLTASNGIAPDAAQTLTIQVTAQAPWFTSPATASFIVGLGNSFPITTSGTPRVTTIAESGALPTGLSFTDHGGGTAGIAGTPTGGTGSYPVTLTASNGIAPDATQTLTIRVSELGGGLQLTVTTTADIAANAGDCGSSSTTVPTPLSLREATCIANNYGNSQGVTINVPAGHYTLTSGELRLGKVSGSNIALTGAGSAGTVIDGNHASRVLELDPLIVGGVQVGISGVTITNGRDDTFGGAGLIGGSDDVTTLDMLLVSNSVFSNNQANFGVPTAGNRPGGGLSFDGGSLGLTNVTFSGNQSFSSAGAGVFYKTLGYNPSQTLTITGCTFTGNSTSNTGADGPSGGALAVSTGGGGSSYTVSNSTFTGNISTSSDSSEPAAGGAILMETGRLTVIGSTFTGNAVSGTAALGGSVLYTGGTATLHYNRFVGNPGSNAVVGSSGDYADATENWWGCNTGPNTAGCDTDPRDITAPWLVLAASASPSQLAGPNSTATITASLLTDSAGSPVPAADLAAFDGLPVSFADPPGDATVSTEPGSHTVNLAGGLASIDYHSNSTLGPDDDPVTLDNATIPADLEVDAPPAIASADHASFTVGTAGSFTVSTAASYPAITGLTESGALPAGLSFTDNGDGTATIAGTPSIGSGWTYGLRIAASNGSDPDAGQAFTLTVVEPPRITSTDQATFRVGSAGSFTVFSTAGFPTATALTESGSLPAGIGFTDNGDGTATLAGTASTGSGGNYLLTITAGNGVEPDAGQAFTLTVTEPARVTSADQATFTAGSPASFTVTTSAGYPVATTLAESGPLPPGVSFTDNGNGTATITGTPAGSGSYPVLLRASNGVSPSPTQSFTLTVGPPLG